MIDFNSRISVRNFGRPVMLMSDRLMSTFSYYALRLEYGVACLLIYLILAVFLLVQMFIVDVGGPTFASLPILAFEGATRRNTPNLQAG